MYSKINIKTLGLIFAGLLGLVVIVMLADNKKGDRTFKSDLLELDTASVNKITIYPRTNPESFIMLNKKAEGWEVEADGKVYPADNGSIANMLGELEKMKPKRIAATNKDNWNKFEVTDSLSTRVALYAGKGKEQTFYIGKFSYQQPSQQNPYSYNQQGTMTSYVRIGGEKEVYAVDGFLSMTFNREAKDLRNKTVIAANSKDVTRLSFQYPADSSYSLYLENNNWMTDGIMADSSSVASFINNITRTTSSNFVDEARPLSNSAVYKLTVEGNNLVSPIVVEAYPADSTLGLLLTSSQNPGAYFSGNTSGLTNRIFKGLNEFKVKQ
ncbi:MAG: DUF4340 domain-containing protein [Bacteroidales bacterium]|nr:DUF4340 domain-containing protein [Bacteroidales bacterium]